MKSCTFWEKGFQKGDKFVLDQIILQLESLERGLKDNVKLGKALGSVAVVGSKPGLLRRRLARSLQPRRGWLWHLLGATRTFIAPAMVS